MFQLRKSFSQQAIKAIRNTTTLNNYPIRAASGLSKILQKEITYEEQNISEDDMPKNNTSFKYSAGSGPGEIVFSHEKKGFKIKLSGDVRQLAVEADEEVEDGRNTMLPIKIELTPSSDSSSSLLFSGDLHHATYDNSTEEAEPPFFTPESLVVGKSGNIDIEKGYSPQMNELEESLQEEFSDFLTDLELNEELFEHVLSRAEYEEAKLYLDWLKSVKKVVDAGKN